MSSRLQWCQARGRLGQEGTRAEVQCEEALDEASKNLSVRGGCEDGGDEKAIGVFCFVLL